MSLKHALFTAALIAATAPGPALAAAATDLGIAASAGDTGRIKVLIGGGQNINAADAEGYTPLMWAALNGQINAVSTLIHLGAALDPQDKEGYTALMWATQNKYETVVRQLLNAGAAVNLRDKHGYTALHWSAQDGQLRIARVLLSKGADPNAQDNEGYTPLMWAAQQGHREVVHELLALGANPDLKDRRGYTAAELAGMYKHPLVRAQIRNHRAKVAAAAGTAGAPNAGGGVATASVTRPANGGGSASAVPVKSDAEPKLVAVVGAPDTGAAPRPAMTAELQARLLKYDVDRNRVIDGRDWRNLVATNSRTTLATMLHEARCGRRDCLPHTMSQVLAKLDWVYADPTRRELTLNQAWEVPSHHFEQIRW
ncbi:MAG: ankyrin repeat domain-containing protein [Candidatus Sericytochromatia bacterium]|nr:ankyrin repeat domain-containing protein [Candidatus Sericytochromatia bacterium]